MARWLVLSLAFVVSACATYREDLNRGQRLFEDNEYESSLAVWRMLEPDYDVLEYRDRVRYCYLRGMTDYRLGYKRDARHWLAVSRALESEHPGGLQKEWIQRMDEALEKLNAEYWGIESKGTDLQKATVQ